MNTIAVEPVANQNSLGFYNWLFLVPKPNNRWRPILDLSTLNTFLNTESFKMETQETIRTSLQVGEWVTSIDFKDTYFHIPQSVQEVHAFSHPGPVLPVKALPFGLSTALMEFTVVAKEVKLMALQRGIRIHQYLDDWLVRATFHQICLQHTQTLVALCRELGWLVNKEKSELVPKTGFQLRRLPVRPQGGQGQTHTRALADLNRQDIVNSVWSSVPGLALHVPHRAPHSHRKASPPRSTSYETHIVALEEQLESTRIIRKGDTHSQIAPPPPKVVDGGKQCAFRSTITPTKTYSADIYRRIKRRVGCSLKRAHSRGTWSLPESKLHINHLELKAVFLALKEFQDLCSNNIVLVATDNTTVVAYINKEGGMKSGSLYALLWRILSWCTRKQVTLRARHIPGRLNVIADKLSRLGQTIQTEWSLHPEVFQAICLRWIFLPPDSTNYHSLSHWSRTPRHGQWMHSVCPGRIWIHMPSHQQPSWAK